MRGHRVQRDQQRHVAEQREAEQPLGERDGAGGQEDRGRAAAADRERHGISVVCTTAAWRLAKPDPASHTEDTASSTAASSVSVASGWVRISLAAPAEQPAGDLRQAAALPDRAGMAARGGAGSLVVVPNIASFVVTYRQRTRPASGHPPDARHHRWWGPVRGCRIRPEDDAGGPDFVLWDVPPAWAAAAYLDLSLFAVEGVLPGLSYRPGWIAAWAWGESGVWPPRRALVVLPAAAVLVTLVPWLADLYLEDLGQPGRAVAVLSVMEPRRQNSAPGRRWADARPARSRSRRRFRRSPCCSG